MDARDISSELLQKVIDAVNDNSPLQIHGGKTKQFLGRPAAGNALDVSAHRGIINYEPTELVITARSGTPLKFLEQTLADNNQMLAFEPPHFGQDATLGGAIACNLSGPRRPYAGAARDFVLGMRLINGQAGRVRFGGEVMKNVAGYDVSRLMTGAMGTLGVLLDISLKVLPKPGYECTLMQTLTVQQALDNMHYWAQRPLPVSATCYDGEALYIRLSGTPRTVDAAIKTIGGDQVDAAGHYWQQLKEHGHAFFQRSEPLWRLSLASDTPPMPLDGDWCYEWGGAQRWLVSGLPADVIQRAASAAGGHATLYRQHGMQHEHVFQPLSAGLKRIHQRLKSAMDPHGIFNPGRLYQGI